MGATTFYDHVRTDKTSLRTAFDILVKQTKWEEGHGGYTGTIAEKDSYRIVNDYPSQSAAETAAYDQTTWPDWLDNKWGPAGAFTYPGGAYLVGWASE